MFDLGEASVNSRNSPVTRKATCSPMSTALSPTRSSWRDTTYIRIPHSSLCLSSDTPSTCRSMPRFSRSMGSSSSGSFRASSRWPGGRLWLARALLRQAR
jgi:hypothetical protein